MPVSEQFWEVGPVVGAAGPEVRPSLEEQFERFHAANPRVYRMLRGLALQMKARGRVRYGIAGLWEVLRWQISLESGEDFKLNNNHRAFYARLLMEQEPALEGFFEIREQTAA